MTLFQGILLVLGAVIALVLLYQVLVRLGSSLIRRRQQAFIESQDWVLLKILVPKRSEKDAQRGPIVMEQIFSTLSGVRSNIGLFAKLLKGHAQPRMSFEIVHREGLIAFYCRVPRLYRKLLEGQLYAQYPEVEIDEVEDYHQSPDSVEVMTPGAQSSELSASQELSTERVDPAFQKVQTDIMTVAELCYSDPYFWPLKTYEYFLDKDDKTQIDTLSALTSTMSKLNRDGDEASFQMVIAPADPRWQQAAKRCLAILKQGYFRRWAWSFGRFASWYPTTSFWHHWLIKAPFTLLMKIPWKLFGLVNPVEESSLAERQEVGFSYWELPQKKFSKLGYHTTIRVAYKSRLGNAAETQLKVREMVASFQQFQWPDVNGLKVRRMGTFSSDTKEDLLQSLKKRRLQTADIFAVDELATLWHLPMWNLETPNIAWIRAKKLEPPADLPTPKKHNDLTMLGTSNFRASQKDFGIKLGDRRRHMYIIGKTGMGKSTVLENMIYDDIQKGRGVAVVDPHGELADKVVSMIPASRINDAVIFDPSDTNFPVSFNMLEVKSPEHRPLVASGLVGVFKKMYADSWGPRLEYILRNTILALTEFEGATLLGIPRMLVDPVYREKVVSQVKDPVVKAFWVDEFANMSDKLRTEAISPIQNKVGQFLSSPVIRNILGQVKSSIDIRFAMDTKKIFVVNLSKGKIGEDNSSLLGSMLITKFQLDAMSRADIDAEKREDFYLYVDEFQNFATDSFATILSEARKYKLNLVMANQYVQQMEEEVMHAVFGNVGTLITFQVGYDDAEYFSKQFGEVVTPADIISIPKFTTYIRMLVDNMPTKVFSARMNPPVEVDMRSELRQKVLEASRERYGKNREVVEDKIQRWSSQIAAPEVKKAIAAQSNASSVRWRYDRNKSEFEDVLKSAGKKFEVLEREQFDEYGIKDAVNEFVYHVPAEKMILLARIDTQGKIFNKKENEIEVLSYAKKKDQHESVGTVEKAPGWQLGLNKLIGGGFRNPQNREEMEKVFEKAGYQHVLVDRKDFDQYGLEKALNELVYRISKGDDWYLVISALDPQGDCFTRNPDQVIQICEVKKKKPVQKAEVKKSLDWKEELEGVLKGL